MKTWPRKTFYILTAFVAFPVTINVFIVGMGISYEEQSRFFEIMRSTAAIIFGVSGAWLAISYPKAIMSSERAQKAKKEVRDEAIRDADNDAKVLIGFVNTMLVSIFVISFALFVPFIKDVLSYWDWPATYVSIFRGSLYCAFWILAIIQLTLLAATVKNTLRALKDVRSVLAKAGEKGDRERNREY